MRRATLVLPVGVLAVTPVVVAWLVASVGHRAIVLPLGVAVLAAGAIVLATRRSNHRALMLGGLVALVVVTASTIALTVTSRLSSVRLAAARSHLDAVVADLVGEADEGPVTLDCRRLDQPVALPGGGRVVEACPSGREEIRQVRFEIEPGDGQLIWVHDGSSPGVHACVAELGDGWWETAPADPNCPVGFSFHSMG